MAERKAAAKVAPKSGTGFTTEERAAMRARAREMKAAANQEQAEAEVLVEIAKMPVADRAMAERIHAIVKATAPGLSSRTWYGMPAYAKDDRIICFFKAAAKFKERYATLGFSDEATLDEGRMWPNAYALTGLTAADEAKIAALVKKAVGPG
ncbi:MAG: DUF1801 domain-containing protein [Thermoplasmata archaeon]|nr:DUF1801 domain-containing protein [Thermoplasmata archaeon]